VFFCNLVRKVIRIKEIELRNLLTLFYSKCSEEILELKNGTNDALTISDCQCCVTEPCLGGSYGSV
jgi:hypothetical protein